MDDFGPDFGDLLDKYARKIAVPKGHVVVPEAELSPNYWKQKFLIKYGVVTLGIAAIAFVGGLVAPRHSSNNSVEVSLLTAKVSSLSDELKAAKGEKERVEKEYEEHKADEPSRFFKLAISGRPVVYSEKTKGLDKWNGFLEECYKVFGPGASKEHKDAIKEIVKSTSMKHFDLKTEEDLDRYIQALTETDTLKLYFNRAEISKPAGDNSNPAASPPSTDSGSTTAPTAVKDITDLIQPSADIPHFKELIDAYKKYKNATYNKYLSLGEETLQAENALYGVQYSLAEAVAFISKIDSVLANPTNNEEEAHTFSDFITYLVKKYLDQGSFVTLKLAGKNYFGLGRGIKNGTLVLEGYGGQHPGWQMTGGTLIIKGDVEDIYDSKGGTIIVEGNVNSVGEDFSRIENKKIEIKGNCKKANIGGYCEFTVNSVEELSIESHAKVTVYGNVKSVKLDGGNELTVKGDCGIIQAASRPISRWPNIGVRIEGNFAGFEGKYVANEIHLNKIGGIDHEKDSDAWLKEVQKFVENKECKIYHNDELVYPQPKPSPRDGRGQ